MQLTWLKSNVLCQGAYRTFSAGCSWNPTMHVTQRAVVRLVQARVSNGGAGERA
jgi:hypothetical protein